MNDNITSTDLDKAAGFRPMPEVRAVTAHDIMQAFRAGLHDFQSAPLYGLAFGAFFAVGGLLVVLCAAAFGMSYLSYPLAAGFALIGPFACVGLYEISRRLETGSPISFGSLFSSMWQQKGRELAWMAFVVLFVMIMWMYQVRLLLALFMGFQSFASLGAFVQKVLTTGDGLMFLMVGHLVGAALSLILFSLTVISFPLLLEQDRDFTTAMITSIKVVTTSPLPLLGWGLVVTLTLVLSIVPFFGGLIITLPILGHTTWHLYKATIIREPASAP